jgi:hypothetical protein
LRYFSVIPQDGRAVRGTFRVILSGH